MIKDGDINQVTVDWGFTSSDNQAVNQILDEIRTADHAGDKLDPATVQGLISRLTQVTGQYPVLADIAETAFIWHLTGKGNTANQGARVAPFISPETLRTMIDFTKHSNRRY